MGDYRVGDLSQLLQSSGTKLTSAAASFLTSKKPSPEKHSTQISLKKKDEEKKKKKKKLEKIKLDSSTAVTDIKSGNDSEISADSKSKKKRKRKKKSVSETTETEVTPDTGNDNKTSADSKSKKKRKRKKKSVSGITETEVTPDNDNETSADSKSKKKRKRKKKSVSGTTETEVTSGIDNVTLTDLKIKKRKKGKDLSKNGSAETGMEQEDRSISHISNSEKKKKKKKKKKKTSVESAESNNSQSTGFNPPPGIIHESKEANTEKPKEAKKRKMKDDESEEDEIESKKSKQDKTRHRRDRLKKKNENRTIFIGNIPISIKKRDLLKLFKDFGQIESMRLRCLPVNDPSVPKRVVAMKGDFHPSRHNCVAYICFKEEECARKALSQNGKEVDGLHIRVDMAGKIDKTDMKLSVFVGNLPYDLEEEVLRNHFDDCGKIENIRIVRDRKTCIGKGFGYVKFADKDGVSLAAKLNGSTLKKREIRVMPCVAKVKKSKDPETSSGKKSFNKGKPGERKKPDMDNKRQNKFSRDNRSSPHQQQTDSKKGAFSRDAFAQNKHRKNSTDKPLSHIVFDDDSDGEKQQKANNKYDKKSKKNFNKVNRKQTKKLFRPSNVRKNPFHTKLTSKESKKHKQKTNKPKS